VSGVAASFVRMVALVLAVVDLFSPRPSALILIAMLLLAASTSLLAGDAIREVRHTLRVASWVDEDRALVADIVEKWMGKPPDFETTMTVQGLEDQIRLRMEGKTKPPPKRPPPDKLRKPQPPPPPKRPTGLPPSPQHAMVAAVTEAVQAGMMSVREAQATLEGQINRKALTDATLFEPPDMEDSKR
jgi:hypothetical protein